METTIEMYGLSCGGHCGAEIQPHYTRAMAWDDAMALGWKMIWGRHYCPACAAKQKAQGAAPARKGGETA